MARQRAFDKQEVTGRAMLLFRERGYEATSIRDLIEAMGISSSSMYEVFGDKRGVFLAALEQSCEQERAQIAQMARDEQTPDRFIERLFTSLETAAQTQSNTQGSLAFNTMVEYGTRDPDITQLLLTHYFGIARIIADVIKQGQAEGTVSSQQDPEHLAYAILSALHGVATIKGVQPDFPQVTAIARLLIQLLHL